MKRIIRNGNFVRTFDLSLKVIRGSSEDIWSLRGFFTVSLISTLIKYSSFIGAQDARGVLRIWSKIMEIKVTEINAPLNKRRKS